MCELRLKLTINQRAFSHKFELSTMKNWGNYLEKMAENLHEFIKKSHTGEIGHGKLNEKQWKLSPEIS